jgi:large subunit ribosomal protein L24
MNIRKDDTVLVIAGKDKGKKGKVRFAYPEKNKILVGSRQAGGYNRP